MIKCQICAQSQPSLVELEGHIIEDHLKCVHCDTYQEEYLTKDDIVRHIKKEHLSQILDIVEPSAKRSKIDTNTDVEVTYVKQKWDLKNSQIEKKQPEFVQCQPCQFCSFISVTNVELQKHLAVSHNYCNICCKKFEGINVRIHLMSEHQISITENNLDTYIK